MRRRFNVRRSPSPPRCHFHSLPLLSLSYYFTISILLLYNLYLITLQSLSYYFTISILSPSYLYPLISSAFRHLFSPLLSPSALSPSPLAKPPPCLGRQPVTFAVLLFALSLARLAASPFLLLLSSPPFLSPPPPIPPCALAFLRQALRRPLLAKPPPCLGRQPVIFSVPLFALSLAAPLLAASPFLLLLSSPPFLSPPPPIPPCALAFLRQALRRPLLAKPPLCLGRQPVTFAVLLFALSLAPSLSRLSFCSSPARLSCRPRLLSLLVRWRFYAKRSVAPY